MAKSRLRLRRIRAEQSVVPKRKQLAVKVHPECRKTLLMQVAEKRIACALERVLFSYSGKELSKILNVSPSCVSRWRNRVSTGKDRAGKDRASKDNTNQRKENKDGKEQKEAI